MQRTSRSLWTVRMSMSPFGTVTGSIQGSLCSGYRTAHCRQFAVPSCRKVSTHYVLPRTYSTIHCSMRAGMTKATYGQRGGCGWPGQAWEMMIQRKDINSSKANRTEEQRVGKGCVRTG